MASLYLVLLVVLTFIIFYSRLPKINNGYSNPADYMIGQVPQYRVDYRIHELPHTTKQTYKDTDSYYYPPFDTKEPAQYKRIFKAKNFWPVYVEKGEDPDARLAWVRDAPYHGKWELPPVAECPSVTTTFQMLNRLEPTTKPIVQPFGN